MVGIDAAFPPSQDALDILLEPFLRVALLAVVEVGHHPHRGNHGGNQGEAQPGEQGVGVGCYPSILGRAFVIEAQLLSSRLMYEI